VETFLRRLDHAKVTAEQGRKEAIELEEPHGNPQGNPDIQTEGSRPKKSFPKTTTKAPPITQEVEGVGNLNKEEEELNCQNVFFCTQALYCFVYGLGWPLAISWRTEFYCRTKSKSSLS